MYQQYDSGVSKVIQALSSESNKRANRHYFALLRGYLEQNTIPYSHQSALEWLLVIEDVFSHRKYVSCRNAVFKLNDIMTNGRLSATGQYPYTNAPQYRKLPKWGMELLDSALCQTRYSGSTKNNFRIAVAEFLYFLESLDVKKAEEISVKHFTAYVRYMKKERSNIAAHKIYVRYVGVFLSETFSTNEFSVLKFIKRIYSTIIIDDLPDAQRKTFAEAAKAGESSSLPLQMFFEAVRREDERLELRRCTTETRRSYLGFWKTFGVFLVMNGLNFSPQLVKCWTNHCGRKLDVNQNIEELPQPKLTSAQRNMTTLPAWSRELLEQYISKERRRGQAQTTLETQRYACISFLRFLEQRRVVSCDGITPEVLMAFNLEDHHTTSEGKKGYNSRIGRFIGFLGEQGFVSETLRFALPCKVAKQVAIVKILNESEINLLYDKKDAATSPIALRDAAIVMIGLRMGLRAGDITNIKLCDISWRKRTISVRQNKTGKHLVLPMPVLVGNCIYRYLSRGRPISEVEYIFVSHNPPYSKLKSAACGDATRRMLFGNTRDVKGYGSRIIRKTFASEMLKAGNSVDTIANALGHDGTHTVMTYLSTDDERMRLCAIPAGNLVRQ